MYAQEWPQIDSNVTEFAGSYKNYLFQGHRKMNTFLRTLLLTSFLLSGHAVLATPEADARLIVQRALNSDTQESFQRSLKSAFVTVYFRPISELGIEIANEDRFIDLIPDEDVAPYIERYVSDTIELYLKVYTPEQLASVATIMRVDQDATMQEILSDQYLQDFTAEVEQIRSQALLSGSEDPQVVKIEELVFQMNVLSAMLSGGVGEALAQSMGIGAGHVFALLGFLNEIDRIEKEKGNLVTVAALKADGVLKFSNPVQRQILLRELTTTESTSGIKFLKPPAKTGPSE